MATYLWDTPKISKEIIEHTALGHLGQPEDIVGTAILLASDASRHITGQTIVVDGGNFTSGEFEE